MQNKQDESISLEGKIKAEAFRLGFSLCGFTTCDSPAGFDRYEHWLSIGHHAEMSYLESTRHRSSRQYPDQLFKGVKTIISLGWPYALNIGNNENSSDKAFVAGYAAGTDYHFLLPAKLEELIIFLRKEISNDVNAQAYSDSAPILEREIASRAGLGWIGKNSCLLSPEIGSAFLLAELFVDVTLKPDPPFVQDRCGTCHRCIDACPTNCIQPNRTIDSNRCLSYLTIENKGSIQEELRPSLGKWLFGCDICQSVCPWNNGGKSQPTQLVEQIWSKVEVHTILSITPEEFSNCFEKTSLYRAKLKGLQRNALVWLGNNGDPTDQNGIKAFVQKTNDPVLISTATWAIEKLKQ